MELSTQGLVVQKPEDIVKDPMILEFLGFPEQAVYSETELETRLLNHLQEFIMELGTGFTFSARQKRFVFDEDTFYLRGEGGQHITVETVVWLPAFLRFRGDHMGNFPLHSYPHLCYTSIRRGCGSRLFFVHEKFMKSSLKSSRIFGTIYVYQYAISEGLRNRMACRYKDWELRL